MPSFETDLQQEEILSKYLDNIYNEKKLHFTRIDDLNQQHEGIDVVIYYNSTEYYIDEKAQLHYINNDLPTFTFELSYLKNNEIKNGWLFDKSKKTQYYFLVTGIFLKNGIKLLKNSKDIEQLKITSVNRKKLVNYLASIGLNEINLMEYDTGLRANNSFGKNYISELNPKKEGLLYFTKELSEKPINLQLRLNHLVKQNIAKVFYQTRLQS